LGKRRSKKEKWRGEYFVPDPGVDKKDGKYPDLEEADATEDCVEGLTNSGVDKKDEKYPDLDGNKKESG
jgi:hypothetical protein